MRLMFFCLLNLSVLDFEYLIIILIYGALGWTFCWLFYLFIIYSPHSNSADKGIILRISHPGNHELQGRRLRGVRGSAAGRWQRGVHTSARFTSTLRFPLSFSSILYEKTSNTFFLVLFVHQRGGSFVKRCSRGGLPGEMVRAHAWVLMVKSDAQSLYFMAQTLLAAKESKSSVLQSWGGPGWRNRWQLGSPAVEKHEPGIFQLPALVFRFEASVRCTLTSVYRTKTLKL